VKYELDLSKAKSKRKEKSSKNKKFSKSYDLPKVEKLTNPDLPAVFSPEQLKVTRSLDHVGFKSDPRVIIARVARDAAVIDSKGAGKPYAVVGGHISRELGITVNGSIPVGKVITMYAHNAPGSKDVDILKPPPRKSK
jgi:hypothetical protein